MILHLKLHLKMISGFINILCVVNDIQIIYIHWYNTKSCGGSFYEDTWTIIIIRVTLTMEWSFDLYIHIVICAYIRYRNPIGASYICPNLVTHIYVVTMSFNCIDRNFWFANDIKYRNIISLMTREYVSLKSMSSLYVNPCATSLTLYLTTLLFSFRF